ncbi:ArsR/SmtB family transcription factor [Arthrobacter sp. 2RAF6]|uniref:ArsR/SmtB family transcription factor n=1 Tax=Arthrobacter sp. 2RAF6 TaxID=3233002 RepID=UPI003F9312E9
MASRTYTPLTHPEVSDMDLFRLMEAMTDPVRLRIVIQLANSGDDIPCTEFALPVTKSAGTRHFRVLREAGVIRQYDVGVRRMSRLRSDDLEARFPGLLKLILQEAPNNKRRERRAS